MEDKVNKSSDFKSCVGPCEKLLETSQFDIEGNNIAGKFRVVGAGAPKKAVEIRKVLFEYFIDIRSALKARLPKALFLGKTKLLYEEYCEQQRKQIIEPEKLIFSNQWLKDWFREHQTSMKKPNKRFSITAEHRKKRILDFLINMWTARYTFMKIYGVDPKIAIAD